MSVQDVCTMYVSVRLFSFIFIFLEFLKYEVFFFLFMGEEGLLGALASL